MGRRQAATGSSARPRSRAREGRRPSPWATGPSDDLPFYYGLARTFPLADRWFCSCLGPTFPNRRFLITGTAHGLIDDLPWNMADYPPHGTIFDAAHPPRHLLGELPPGGRGKTVLRRALGGTGAGWLQRRLASLGRWLPQADHAARGQGHAVHRRHVPARLRPATCGTCAAREQFFADADRGHAARGSASSTPTSGLLRGEPAGHREGRGFAAEVVNAVMHGPGWAVTLLIWTLRRARRLLRPRAAARRGRAGRRARPQLAAAAAVVHAAAQAAVPGLRQARRRSSTPGR